MFKGKKKAKTYSENPDRLNRLVSGTKIKGDIFTESSLRVDGEIIGNVVCKAKLVLGEEGVIKGDIDAVEVEVDGVVEGSIDAADLLVLHKTAKITGDVISERLVIEDGAELVGNIQVLGKNQVRPVKVKDESDLSEKILDNEPTELIY